MKTAVSRLVSLFLLLLLVCLPAACAEANDTPSGTPTPADDSPSGTPTVTEEPRKVTDWTSTGIEARDFEGKDFVYLSRTISDYAWYEFTSEEGKNGEALNDAICARNEAIEEAFHVNITTEYVAKPMTTLDQEISAGDDNYDVINDWLTDMYAAARTGRFYNWYDVKDINPEASWWDKTVIDQLSYHDKLYFCIGDISPVVNIRVYSVVINKDLCNSLGFELPYSYVENGTWTLEVFDEYITNVNMDVNGDDKMDYSDRWGFFTQNSNSLMMYYSGGGSSVRLNEDGDYELTFLSEENMDLATIALTITNDESKTLKADAYVQANGGWPAASAWFAAGNALFRCSCLEPVVRDYRSMETDFGVLPFPKLDEDQESYHTLAEQSSRLLAIPTTADKNYSGLMLEVLSAQSVDTVSPAFYDVCLSGRSVRDTESVKSLDILFSTKVFDVGLILNLGGISGQFTGLENKHSSDVASAFESIYEAAQTALNRFVEDMDALD